MSLNNIQLNLTPYFCATGLKEELEEKDTQLATSSGEVQSLTDYNTKLQDDFDEVQNMLEKKQQDNEGLIKELEELRAVGATEHIKV